MANRVLEMGDVILAMADNIGMVADQIWWPSSCRTQTWW
jgi:hypothetical protein